MTYTLILSAWLLVQAPAFRCPVDDINCWRDAALTQQERAERAEGRVVLLEEAVAIGNRLLREADSRGDRWQKLAEHVAPKEPALWERPTFWLALGFGLGAATTVAITYAVSR